MMDKSKTHKPEAEEIVHSVRDRYGRIAREQSGGCCAPAENSQDAAARRIGYGNEDLDAVPEEANLGLGCGAPVGFLELQPGETVLDLGSGPGLDALLAAQKVGPDGRVIGIDMTPDMLERARQAAGQAGAGNVEFREGRLEELPLPDASVDAVTSNCVINLVPDKSVVFREVFRVLRPGGRLVISDIILDGELPEMVARDLLAWVGCIAGALRRETYFRIVEESGLGRIEILSDVDFLPSEDYAQPPELDALIGRHRIAYADLAGVVRSVMFRAYREA
jgi:SAM-dependent methyltransferase